MQVDFYLLESAGVSDIVPRLVAKAWPEHRDIVIAAPESVLDALDPALWEKPGGRFLPHDRDGSAPIRLQTEVPAECALLIHLHPVPVPPRGRFGRVLEVVGPDEADRAPARKRFKAWKDAGVQLRHHRL